MKVFVVNCGSSSIKYQLFDMTDESVIAGGIMERVGTDEAMLHLTVDRNARKTRKVGKTGGGDHHLALQTILKILVDEKVIESVEMIEGVGHRVVHGGEAINDSCLIDEGVLEVIRGNCELAPLHNPPNLAGIKAAMAAMGDIPHVAVFDTAFLASLPPRAYRYAIPEQWYTQYHIRRYGFHGTSHRYVTLRMGELLDKRCDELNLITVHLGNGCSMTAVAGGKSVDHSMGLTPLEGLVMGTRSGDIDPAIVLYLGSKGIAADRIDSALNKDSGLLGLSARSNDMRDLLEGIEQGDEKAKLAVEIFVYRIVKYVGAYYAILPELDAVVLTGGIGENAVSVRSMICRRLGRVGVVFDEGRNEQTIRGRSGPISTDDSPLSVWV
ncbi:MAG: acetate kinase, partial [Planctomycetota bacterium]